MTLNFDRGEFHMGKTLVSAGHFSVWEPVRSITRHFGAVVATNRLSNQNQS